MTRLRVANKELIGGIFLLGLSAGSSAISPSASAPGYQAMGVLDFVIDGPKLAHRGARVDVSGVYIREGAVDVLYADTTALARAHTMPNPQPHVTVITENATRELRAHLVQCQTDPMSMQLGCAIAIRGRVAICEVTSALGIPRQEPCLEAESEAPSHPQRDP